MERRDPARTILFVHIPRTAGTSVTDFLQRSVPPGTGLNVADPWGDSLDTVDILDEYSFIGGHFGMDVRQRFEQPPRVLTFLRDPVTRIVSLYHFGRSRDTGPVSGTGQRLIQIARQSTLEEFALHEDPDIQRLVRNAQTWQLSDGHWTRPYRAPDAESLERAKRQLDTCDFVGILEQLPDCFASMCERLSLDAGRGLDHLNAAPEGMRTQKIASEFRRALGEHLRLDFELYEHALQLAAGYT